ncbi:MAG: HTH-type transcriptional activator IlvY [Polyangiaceae bacterium]|nr:HTH-type transcriptional activator IlvY [Polyangiaceae bacterium]
MAIAVSLAGIDQDESQGFYLSLFMSQLGEVEEATMSSPEDGQDECCKRFNIDSKECNICNMDQRDLRAFEGLATSLHFARASKELGMSPSALTRRIQGIEEELGTMLLLRDRRQLGLTQAGRRFLQYCRAEQALFDELKADLKHEEETPSGELKIACTVTACHSILPRLLADFRQKYPRVTIQLITQDAARSLEQLEESEVDLAVIPSDGAIEEIAERRLGFTEFSLIAPTFPAFDTAESLKKLPFIAPAGGLERIRLDEWLAQMGIEAAIGAEVRGNEGIIALVSLGGGVALVPELVLNSSPLRSKVRILGAAQLPPGYAISLCALKRSLKRRLVELFWNSAGSFQEPQPSLSPNLKIPARVEPEHQ